MCLRTLGSTPYWAEKRSIKACISWGETGGGGGGVGEGIGVGVGVGVWVGVGDGDSMGVEATLKTFSDSFSEITQIVPGIAIKRSKRKKYFKKDFKEFCLQFYTFPKAFIIAARMFWPENQPCK